MMAQHPVIELFRSQGWEEAEITPELIDWAMVKVLTVTLKQFYYELDQKEAEIALLMRSLGQQVGGERAIQLH